MVLLQLLEPKGIIPVQGSRWYLKMRGRCTKPRYHVVRRAKEAPAHPPPPPQRVWTPWPVNYDIGMPLWASCQLQLLPPTSHPRNSNSKSPDAGVPIHSPSPWTSFRYAYIKATRDTDGQADRQIACCPPSVSQDQLAVRDP